MSEVFLNVVNASISASWVILVVLILRLAFRKTPKWIHVLLWGIVALRLVCPISFESALSLIPSKETIPVEILEDKPEGQLYDPAVFSVVDNPKLPEVAVSTGTSEQMVQANFSILCIVWVIGVTALLFYTAVSYWRLCRRVRTAVLIDENIYKSDYTSSPFVLGIIKPKIYLPAGIEEQSLQHVIAHERAHILRGDHWWKPFGFLLLSIHWFNPLMWLAYVLLCRDIELACDEKVIKKLEHHERADYSQALLECSINRYMIAACLLAFGEVGVKDRIKSVLSYKKPSFWVVFAAIITSAVISVCFLTNPFSDQEVPEKLSANTCEEISIHNLSIKTTDGSERIDITEFEQIDGMVDLLSKTTFKRTFRRFPEAPNGLAATITLENSEKTFLSMLMLSSPYGPEYSIYVMNHDSDGDIYYLVAHDPEQLSAYICSLITAAHETQLDSAVITNGTGNRCNHIPGEFVSREWRPIPNPDSAKYAASEQRWDRYCCVHCGEEFEYDTEITRYKTSDQGRVYDAYLSDESFDDPVRTAVILLSHGFSVDLSEHTPVVSQNNDFWNIAFGEGEYSYLVELSRELPFPQTLYQFHKTKISNYNNMPSIAHEGELVDIAEEFLWQVYALPCDDAQIDVYQYGSKYCVQFTMSDTEVFHVRIRAADLEPSGILFFNNIETAQYAIERARQVEEDILYAEYENPEWKDRGAEKVVENLGTRLQSINRVIVVGEKTAVVASDKYYHTSDIGISSDSLYEVSVDRNGTTPEMICPNGTVAIFKTEDAGGWNCEEGDMLIFEFEKYPLESRSNQTLGIGYIYDGKMFEAETYQADISGTYQLNIESDGEYFIYVLGASSDPISLKNGVLKHIANH